MIRKICAGSGLRRNSRRCAVHRRSDAAGDLVNADEDLGRCMDCHRSQASQDFVWSAAQMKGIP